MSEVLVALETVEHLRAQRSAVKRELAILLEKVPTIAALEAKAAALEKAISKHLAGLPSRVLAHFCEGRNAGAAIAAADSGEELNAERTVRLIAEQAAAKAEAEVLKVAEPRVAEAKAAVLDPNEP